MKSGKKIQALEEIKKQLDNLDAAKYIIETFNYISQDIRERKREALDEYMKKEKFISSFNDNLKHSLSVYLKLKSSEGDSDSDF